MKEQAIAIYCICEEVIKSLDVNDDVQRKMCTLKNHDICISLLLPTTKEIIDLHIGHLWFSDILTPDCPLISLDDFL